MSEDIQKLAQEVQAAVPKAETKDETQSQTTDSVQDDQVSSQSRYTETEQKAMEQGWKPDYEGDNRVDAKEYLARGTFFKKIADLKKEVQESKQLFKHTADHIQKIERAAYDRARTALLAERDDAIDTGDRAAVHQVEEKIRAQDEQYVRNTLQEPVKTEPQQPPEVQDFLERNKSWCNEDTEENAKMVAQVNEIATFVGKGNEKMVAELVGIKLPTDRPLSVQEKIDLVEATIKKSYPHRFENSNREKPGMVARGRTVGSSPEVSTGLSRNLDAMQREIGEGLVRAKVCKNLDEYAKQLDSYGALAK